MSDPAPPPEDAAPPPAKPSLAMPALLVVNLLMSGGVLAKVFFFSQPPPAPAEHAENKEHAEGKEHAPPPGLGPTLRLADFIVHLRNPEVERYARMSFELEVGLEPDKARLTTQLPMIRELFISYLSDRTVEDLRGSEGIDRVKRELLAKVSSQIPAAPVRAIYVTDIVIQ